MVIEEERWVTQLNWLGEHIKGSRYRGNIFYTENPTHELL